MQSKFTVLFLVLLFALPMLFNGLLAAPPDTVTIKQLQFVPDPGTDDLSLFNGDTVVVKGMVMHGPRELWVGARWAVYIVDPDSFPDPWNGFFIIQHDTFEVNTNMGFLEPGMICYFTGVVDEFSNFSQINIKGQGYEPDPIVPIEIISAGNPLPDPVVLTAADLETRAVAEQWESMWVRIEDATVVNNEVSGFWASITDGSGATTFLGEYFLWFYDKLRDGSYDWPAPGTALHANGFVRDEPAGFNINPRDTLDLEILSNPPVISDVSRNPGVPTSSDAVIVSATIVDNVTVSEAKLHYSVNWGDFQEVVMTADVDTFSAEIPAQSDGSFVRYFLSAVDNEGDFTVFPGDTSASIYFYVVRDAGLTVKDVQYTWGYPSDISGFIGQEVTLQGVVMTDPTDFQGDYYIQQKDSAWYGIWVVDNSNTFDKGDLIEVTGTVQENFGVTRLNNVTNAEVVTADVGAFDPILVTTGEITTGGENAEAYESVLVKVENVTVTNPFPDAPSNFGEFSVDDGSGAVRVDDVSDAFRGNLDSTFAEGDVIETLIALHYYSFGNYKLLPRDTSDVIGHVTSIEPVADRIPAEFELSQNYPNPFNPSTQINYAISKAGRYHLEIYNVLGQRVRTLVADNFTPGNYQINWNGRDDAGRIVSSGIYFYTLRGEGIQLTKKMIFMR